MLTHNEVWRRYLAPHYPPLLLLLAAALAQGTGGGEYLQYERPAILAGQIWRLWTAHLVHLGWGHYLLNAAGLMLVWLLFRDTMRLQAWCWHFLFAAPVIGLGLLWFNPGLIWYVGLSGILHSLFIAGLLTDMREHRGLDALVLLGFAAKIIFEQIYGALPGSERSAGGPVVVDAHLYGAIAGLISYGLYRAFQRMKTTNPG
jgi:rhomboid family GlyGly-CTERM serine protease